MTVVERRDSAGALVRGDTRRNEQEFLEHELTPSGAGDREVPAVDRVEGAANERELHHLSDASAEGGVRVRRYFRKNPKGVRARA